ncbi:MAG: hypothetical protein JRN52_06215 [Nitrososphaerota archaeon]|nr:hypothetical protein [Nitrososphaerota archaeon]
MAEAKNLRLLGHNELSGYGNGGQIIVKRIGRRKYLAFIGHMKGKSFTILDVSEPSKPEVVHQHEAYEGTLSHKVQLLNGRYLFSNCEKARDPKVTRFDSGFRIFDIKDESNPVEVSYTRVQGNGTHRFWIDNDIAMFPSFVDGFDGRILLIYDIKDLAKPELVTKWWYPGQNVAAGEDPNVWLSKGKKVRAHGPPIRIKNRLYLGYWDVGALIFDCSDIKNLKVISQTNMSPPYGGCTHTVLPISNDMEGRKWLVVTDESMAEHCQEETKLLWIVDATDETHPVPVSTFRVRDPKFCKQGGKFGPHNVQEEFHLKDYDIYASWFSAGVRVVNISDPYSPKEVAYYIPKPNVKKQKVIQTNDLCLDSRGLVYTIDRLTAGVHILERT